MLRFYHKNFTDLSITELYDLLRLRSAVFVVEQNCPYQDVDGKDKNGLHLFAYYNSDFIAYARILKKGIAYKDYVSIGRVVVAPHLRSKGYGHQLMDEAIAVCRHYFPAETIKISAQSHLEEFYKTHHFVPTGETYLEDDIPHIGMILNNEHLNRLP